MKILLPVLPRTQSATASGKLLRRGDGILANARWVIAAEPEVAQRNGAYALYRTFEAVTANYGGFLDALKQYGIQSLTYGGYYLTDTVRRWAVLPRVDRNAIVFYLTAHPEQFNTPGFNYGQQWCAFHGADSAGQPYAVIPYSESAGGCSPSGWTAINALTCVAGHEFVEALTDTPPGTGWVDASGEESDDFSPCVWVPVDILDADGNKQFFQTFWRNDTGACWVPGEKSPQQTSFNCPNCGHGLAVSLA